MIDLRELCKRHGDTLAVDRVSLRVEAGELLVLLGGSGSGKTTTLKMINRLIEPTSGQILVAGEDVRGVPPCALRRRIGYVFQRSGLFPHLTRFLDEQYQIVVAAALGFENTYALAMRRADATRLHIERISQLAPHATTLSVGGDYELFQRPEWRAVQRRYGLAFREQRSMDPSLMYEAARAGEVDVIGAFSTDGRIASYDLQVLIDDRGAIPPYDALVLASPRLARERPAVVQALRALAGTINAEQMRQMNLAVDEQGDSPATVAERFLLRRQ